MAIRVGSTYTICLRTESLQTSQLPWVRYALAEPATLEVTVVSPSGAQTVMNYPADITRTSVAQFCGHVLCDEPGRWAARWRATGDVSGEAEHLWDVVE